MYFEDAYPELTAEQIRTFIAAERRLVTRLIMVGCACLLVFGASFA